MIIDKDYIRHREWEPVLTQLINSSTAFVLVQTEKLHQKVINEDTYVLKEIQIAINKAINRNKFNNESDFLFLCHTDERYRVTCYPELAPINSTNITQLDKIYELAKSIHLSYERTTKRRY